MRTGEFLATEAFRLAVRQVYVKIAVDWVCFLVFGIVSLRLFKHAGNEFRTFQKYLDEENGRTTSDQDKIRDSAWIFTAIAAAFGVMSLINFLFVVSYAINPEWYAMKLLIDTFIK